MKTIKYVAKEGTGWEITHTDGSVAYCAFGTNKPAGLRSLTASEMRRAVECKHEGKRLEITLRCAIRALAVADELERLESKPKKGMRFIHKHTGREGVIVRVERGSKILARIEGLSMRVFWSDIRPLETQP